MIYDFNYRCLSHFLGPLWTESKFLYDKLRISKYNMHQLFGTCMLYVLEIFPICTLEITRINAFFNAMDIRLSLVA